MSIARSTRFAYRNQGPCPILDNWRRPNYNICDTVTSLIPQVRPTFFGVGLIFYCLPSYTPLRGGDKGEFRGVDLDKVARVRNLLIQLGFSYWRIQDENAYIDGLCARASTDQWWEFLVALERQKELYDAVKTYVEKVEAGKATRGPSYERFKKALGPEEPAQPTPTGHSGSVYNFSIP